MRQLQLDQLAHFIRKNERGVVLPENLEQIFLQKVQKYLYSLITKLTNKNAPLEFEMDLCPDDMKPKDETWASNLAAYATSKDLAKMDPMDIGFRLVLNLTSQNAQQDAHIDSLFKLYDVFSHYMFGHRDRIDTYLTRRNS